MFSQINLFYHGVTKELCKLKPTSIEEGQVCVVYWSVMKLWCRAVVESIIMDSVSCKARCLLVDHGERLVVASDQIRVAVQNFLQLPFWVKRFHLARIQPTTLRVCVYQENAELISTAHWDSSATLYLHNLLQASTWTEAVLLESDSDSTSIELYLTIGNIKICVNDDLVAKRFAYYTRESATSMELDEVDRFPNMLSSGILNQSVSTILRKPTAVTQPLAGKHTDVTACSGFLGGDRHQGRACDWLTAPCSPQSQQHELRSSNGDCRPNITEEQLSTGSQSRSSSQTAAAERFLKFLNPGSSYQQVTHSVGEVEELSDCKPKELTLASSPCTGQENCKSSSVESGPAEKEKTRSSELVGTCSRLLEWLNPEPLNLDPEAGDDAVLPSEPRSKGILVHSALPVQPCTSLDDAPITEALRLVLQRKQYSTLSPADCYSWPAVSRGCNTIIVSHIADQPLSYLAPLLTHILLNSIFSSLTSSTGPIAVLLCPGWEKVQQVYDLLEDFKISQVLHPIVLLLGVGKDEAKTVRIPKNCLLLVSTPFSFVRLLSCHCFMFLRLHHLLLDEADQLFTFAPDEMEIILQHFQKVTSSEEKASSPQQLVAVAKRWTSQVEGLLTNHMPYPCIVMTVPEEAALYGNVQQFILMTLESSKISELLGMLDFSPDVGQKTLIIANCAQEVEDVFKAVSHKSAFCLKTHEGLTYQFDFVIQQWRKNIGPGTHVILVTTNECLKSLGIRDASCVIHYGFPTSPKLFGSRLFSMSENFRNLSQQVSTQDQTASSPPVTRSVLLISERNAPHVVGVVRYLGRTNALLPPELLSFGQGIHMAREDLKTNRPFCSYLKSLGVCRDSRACPDRHKFISQLDQSDLPASGVIEVLPLYIKTASVFYGRIVRKDDNGFDGLASEMASYYADKKPGATELSEGGLYAVQEDNTFHRVKILSVPDRGGHLFFSVLVRFIDTGKEEEVKSQQILQLPEQFHFLSCQAVEIIVCRIKPVDAEIDWHPKVTRAISQRIRGLQHRARAVLSLGNTVFVDPMVRVSQVPGMKTVINEYNVQSEILNTGMGVSNPEHLKLLRTLCQEGEDCSSKQAGHTYGLKDNLLAIEVRIKAEEEVLAEVFRAAEARKLSDPPQLEPCEPLSPVGPMNQNQVPATPACHLRLIPVFEQECLPEIQAADEQRCNRTPDLKSAKQMMREGGELCPMTNLAGCLNFCDSGGIESKSQQVTISTKEKNYDEKSFHPQIRWYQTSDAVIVKVKLMNPESQRCDFYLDRVVYSGRVNSQSYRADLELKGNIAVDRCCWEMKSNEPVLKLVKQQKGPWEKLLRNKNIFVSYDVEHFEKNEDKAPNSLWFVGDTGKDNWYVNSESGSESD
ncbi:putative ATP-dependent RNA helicase TDRD12 [Platichthys flesus]|uniref:putative ATP-dependent RNA helicase TDRD12 n=1 Tax=Platichthys flesus TaxID=8260 RepID=UPI002DBB2E81|nr:putative ATP-dependent RNA helicase TDRD12 [Platichthys flesus]